MARLLLSLCLFAAPSQAQDPAEIVRHSVELDQADYERLKNYTYIQTSAFKVHRGNKPDTTVTSAKEIMILEGEPYERLIAVNGKPLSEKEARREQEKMDKEVARRRRESASEKAKQEEERAEDRKFIMELPDAYMLRIEGVEQVSGKPAWAISGEPKPGFRPRNADAKMLAKMRSKVWIDQAEYQWVKAEVDVMEMVSRALALVRLSAGTHSLEQTRVNDEVWLPSHVSAYLDARLAYLLKFNADVEITYSGYKKFQTDSRILPEEEAK
jgi:hypothetical protein